MKLPVVALGAALALAGTGTFAAASPAPPAAPAVPSAASAASPAAVPVTPSYRINPGDQLDVEVVGEQFVTQKVLVAEDGSIGLPLIGNVHVGGSTPSAAAATITHELQRFIRAPQVSVGVLQQGQITVLVLGNVKTAGKYLLRPGAHVSDAIASAGGLDATINGAYPAARVALADGTTKEVALEPLLRGGDMTRDLVLTDRSALYVPGPTQFQVKILGAVDKPGALTINEGDRLSMAIAKAGNSVNSSADLSHVIVTRTEPDGKTAAHEIDLYRALEKGDTQYDPRMRKDDVVYVPIASRAHGALSNGLFLLRRLVGF